MQGRGHDPGHGAGVTHLQGSGEPRGSVGARPNTSYNRAVSLAAAHAAAFYREVAGTGRLWTIRDAGGFQAPQGSDGTRAQPFWSSRGRAERIVQTVSAYAGFEVVEIAWPAFCDRWAPGLEKDGVLVGVNWSGDRATGYDSSPREVLANVKAAARSLRPEGGDPLQDVVGEDLSAVVFVRDYVQLQFDGPLMTVLTPITVVSGAISTRSGDEDFRNVLCGQISKLVVSARTDEGDALTITFSDGSSIAISLKEEDYVGPEAVVIHGLASRLAVL